MLKGLGKGTPLRLALHPTHQPQETQGGTGCSQMEAAGWCRGSRREMSVRPETAARASELTQALPSW